MVVEQMVVAFGTALISAAAAVVSVIFSRRAARADRLSVAEQLAVRFREPVLQATFNLETRIYNIVELGFFERFLTARNTPEEREYAVLNTLYVVAQYFCWIEILRREAQFIDPRNDERNRAVVAALEGVRHAFADSLTIEEPAFRLFRGQQRALGEIMLVPVAATQPGVPRWECLGYAPFVQALDGEPTARWFRSLREDITALSQDLRGHDARLRIVQQRLVDIIDIVDPEERRIPHELRKRLSIRPHALPGASAAERAHGAVRSERGQG